MQRRPVPERISEVAASLRPGEERWALVGGHVLADPPRGVGPLAEELLPPALLPQRQEIVLARLDLEETIPYSRPRLERIDLGRDFYLGDEGGRALVRVGDGGHLHPDVELHLESAVIPVELAAPRDGDRANGDEEEAESDGVRRSLYARTVRSGDPVYVLGRAALFPDESVASYREAALGVAFFPTATPASTVTGTLHLYDEEAFGRLRAWRSLPWYRKLSLLVRNR